MFDKVLIDDDGNVTSRLPPLLAELLRRSKNKKIRDMSNVSDDPAPKLRLRPDEEFPAAAGGVVSGIAFVSFGQAVGQWAASISRSVAASVSASTKSGSVRSSRVANAPPPRRFEQTP